MEITNDVRKQKQNNKIIENNYTIEKFNNLSNNNLLNNKNINNNNSIVQNILPPTELKNLTDQETNNKKDNIIYVHVISDDDDDEDVIAIQLQQKNTKQLNKNGSANEIKKYPIAKTVIENSSDILNPYEHIIQIKKNLLDKKLLEDISEKKIISDTEIIDIKSSSSSLSQDNRYDIKDEMRNLDEFIDEFKTKDIKRLNVKRGASPTLIKNNNQNNRKIQQLNAFDQYLFSLEKKYTKLSSVDKVATWDNQTDVSDVEDVINFEEKRKKLKQQYTQQNNANIKKQQLLRRKTNPNLPNFDNKQSEICIVQNLNDKTMKKPRKTKKANLIINNADDNIIDINNKRIKKRDLNGLNKINKINNSNNNINKKIIELFNNNNKKSSILSAINKIETNYDLNNMNFKLPNSPKKHFIQQGKIIDSPENKEEFYKYLGLGTKLIEKNKSDDNYDIKRRSLRVRRIQMEQQKQQDTTINVNSMEYDKESTSTVSSFGNSLKSKLSSNELRRKSKKRKLNNSKDDAQKVEPKIKIICSYDSNTNTSMPAKIPSDNFRKIENEIHQFLESDDDQLIKDQNIGNKSFSELKNKNLNDLIQETPNQMTGELNSFINQEKNYDSIKSNQSFITRANGNCWNEFNKQNLNQPNLSSKNSNISSTRRSLNNCTEELQRNVRDEIQRNELSQKCDSWIVCKRSYTNVVDTTSNLKINQIENHLNTDMKTSSLNNKIKETHENKQLVKRYVKKAPKNKKIKKTLIDNEDPDNKKNNVTIINELVKAIKESKTKVFNKKMKSSKPAETENRIDLGKGALQSRSISDYSNNLIDLIQAQSKIKIEFSKDYSTPKLDNKLNTTVKIDDTIMENHLKVIESPNLTEDENNLESLETNAKSLAAESNNLKSLEEESNTKSFVEKSSQTIELTNNSNGISKSNCSKIELQQVDSINNLKNNEIKLTTVLSKTSIDSKSTKLTNFHKTLEAENSNDSKQQKQLESLEGREIWTRSKKLKIRKKHTSTKLRSGKSKKKSKILVKQQTNKLIKHPVKRRQRLYTNSDKSMNLCKTAAKAKPLLNDENDEKIDLIKLNNGKIQNSKIKKEEIATQKTKIENYGNIDGSKQLNYLPNPLKFEKGDVFHAYYENNLLIVIQECCVSFWKYSKILQLSGKEQEWQLLGECKRKLNDIEINSPYKNRIAMNDSNPVYIELRASKLDSDPNRECNLSSTYANIYYFDHTKRIAESRSIQLDNFKCATPNIIFTTIINTRYFIVCWKQDTILKKMRSGLCKYSLTPDLQTLASIREFKHLRHYVYSLECCDDDKLIAIGESQITIWEHRSGDILMNFDLGISIGKNLGSLMCTVELENYLFLYQLITNQDTDDQLPELKIFEIKLESSPVYRLIQRHELSLQFDTIKSNLLFNEQYLIVTSLTDEEFWLFIQQPQRLYMLNDDYSTQCKRFYSTNCKQFIEITGDYLNVKPIHENLLNFST